MLYSECIVVSITQYYVYIKLSDILYNTIIIILLILKFQCDWYIKKSYKTIIQNLKKTIFLG